MCVCMGCVELLVEPLRGVILSLFGFFSIENRLKQMGIEAETERSINRERRGDN